MTGAAAAISAKSFRLRADMTGASLRAPFVAVWEAGVRRFGQPYPAVKGAIRDRPRHTV